MSIKYQKLKIVVWSMVLWSDVHRRYMCCIIYIYIYIYIYLYIYKSYVNTLLDNEQVEILRKVPWWLMKVRTRSMSDNINVYA